MLESILGLEQLGSREISFQSSLKAFISLGNAANYTQRWQQLVNPWGPQSRGMSSFELYPLRNVLSWLDWSTSALSTDGLLVPPQLIWNDTCLQEARGDWKKLGSQWMRLRAGAREAARQGENHKVSRLTSIVELSFINYRWGGHRH